MSFLKSLFGSASSHAEILDKNEFAKRLKTKKSQLIDVRTAGEFNAGHIKGAKNIDVMSRSFKEKIEKLDKTKPVFVYCRSGARSRTASKILNDAGFTELYDLKGGYSVWS